MMISFWKQFPVEITDNAYHYHSKWAANHSSVEDFDQQWFAVSFFVSGNLGAITSISSARTKVWFESRIMQTTAKHPVQQLSNNPILTPSNSMRTTDIRREPVRRLAWNRMMNCWNLKYIFQGSFNATSVKENCSLVYLFLFLLERMIQKIIISRKNNNPGFVYLIQFRYNFITCSLLIVPSEIRWKFGKIAY